MAAVENVVARDGIEPPTPAFSGPRSTTELSGLGIGAQIRAAKYSPERDGTEFDLIDLEPAYVREGQCLSDTAFGQT
jgi:hypothetical protein